jgi:hypothetical protein
MAKGRIEAIGVVLDGGRELDATQLRQAGATHQWPELEMAQLLEILPHQAPLILLEGEIPRLGGFQKVVRRQLGVVHSRCALVVEKLLTMIKPVQQVFETVVRRELQLVEA